MALSQADLTKDVKGVLPVANGSIGGVNRPTGTSYTLAAGDNRTLITFNNASAIAVALPDPATLPATFVCWMVNLGAGQVTLTPAAGEIDVAASATLDQSEGLTLFGDGTDYWTVRGGSSSSSGSPSASNTVVTTASLATGAAESGSVTVFKSFTLLAIAFSCKARVELYSAAAARNADASRVWGTAPTAYAQNELICDVQNSDGPRTWVMSPAALGFNTDSPRTSTIYYRITNLDTAQAVTITLTVLQMES